MRKRGFGDLQVLEEEIARLERLVDSFLDFARPPQPHRTRIDAVALVQQVLQLVGVRARQRGVTLGCPSPLETITLDADAAQLRQVLLNLLLNALDAVGEGGRVTVELESQTAGHDGRGGTPCRRPGERKSHSRQTSPHSEIRVCDNGPGVSDQMKEKIFEPFASSKETGMGLGLAVSRRIVEAHGGRLVVADNPGGGARFIVQLPDATPPTSFELEPCKPC